MTFPNLTDFLAPDSGGEVVHIGHPDIPGVLCGAERATPRPPVKTHDHNMANCPICLIRLMDEHAKAKKRHAEVQALLVALKDNTPLTDQQRVDLANQVAAVAIAASMHTLAPGSDAHSTTLIRSVILPAYYGGAL